MEGRVIQPTPGGWSIEEGERLPLSQNSIRIDLQQCESITVSNVIDNNVNQWLITLKKKELPEAKSPKLWLAGR